MRAGAGRCERAGQGEHHDSLALEDVVRGHILPAIRVWALNVLIPNTGFENNFRYFVVHGCVLPIKWIKTDRCTLPET
jgi:hypothetical protein